MIFEYRMRNLYDYRAWIWWCPSCRYDEMAKRREYVVRNLLRKSGASKVRVATYGQMQEDGTVRWYAAETVLDENGKPVVMPRN